MKIENKYLVYENWQATKKVVVHNADCSYAKEGQVKHQRQWLRENHSPHDRWFGYFPTLNEAIAFAALLPDRTLKICGHCLKNQKKLI